MICVTFAGKDCTANCEKCATDGKCNADKCYAGYIYESTAGTCEGL